MTASVRGFFASLSFCLLLSNPLLCQHNLSSEIFDQQGGIEIELADHSLAAELDRHKGITIDHGCTHEKAKLYVTKAGYDYLVREGISFNYLKRPEAILTMKGPGEIPVYKSACLPAMDFYPTYEAYVEMMYLFAEQYPDLCEIIIIGTLDSGRELLVAHLGDELSSNDDEPNFFYTSTMHGDETAGFPLMLQLIDHLLCNYDKDDKVKNLLDNVNIFINPLANPDGTYTDDNSTIQGATRRNANFIDLNRNFPDPEAGENPDNRPTQDETKFFMEFAEAQDIHLSSNIHGGAEVVNYPWDTWEKLHADDTWWIETARAYADTCHLHSHSNYLRGLQNGITNGYAWYEVDGGRQDYMTYFQRSRELLLELSERKIPDATKLPELWEANRRSLVNYMQEALYGLRGSVVDCKSGEPLKAEIIMLDHDKDNSSVFSDSIEGNYFRYLDDGIYEAMIVADGYDTLTSQLTVLDDEVLVWDVELCPEISSIHELDSSDVVLRADQNYLYLEFSQNLSPTSLQLYAVDGKLLLRDTDGDNRLDRSQVSSGAYVLKVTTAHKELTKKLFLP